MAFNYDLANADADIVRISKVRLEIGDTDSGTGAGVRPDGTNLTDEEITVWLDNSSDDVYIATAAAADALARMWATVANVTVGKRREELSAVSAAWASQAVALRAQYGGSSHSAVSISFGADDGYSD